MKMCELINENLHTPAHSSLTRIIKQVGYDYNGFWAFRYSDIQQHNLVSDFKKALLAGLIQFKEPVDWYEPTNPQKVV